MEPLLIVLRQLGAAPTFRQVCAAVRCDVPAALFAWHRPRCVRYWPMEKRQPRVCVCVCGAVVLRRWRCAAATWPCELFLSWQDVKPNPFEHADGLLDCGLSCRRHPWCPVRLATLVRSSCRSFIRSSCRSFVLSSCRSFIRSSCRSFVRSSCRSFIRSSFVPPFSRSIVGPFILFVVGPFSPLSSLHSFNLSFFPSFLYNSPSFIHSFLHSSILSLLPPLIISYFPSFVPSILPSFIHSFLASFLISSLHPSLHPSLHSFLHAAGEREARLDRGVSGLEGCHGSHQQPTFLRDAVRRELLSLLMLVLVVVLVVVLC